MSEAAQAYCCKKPKARKEHSCHECYGTISKGEIYFKHSGIWDNEPACFKLCVDCEELMNKINSKTIHWEERVCFGELFEQIAEAEDYESYAEFLDIKQKRGAKIPPWMVNQLDYFTREKEQKETEKEDEFEVD